MSTAKPFISTREREILDLIAHEYTSNEIADHLFISPKTVITHRRNMMIKLDVRNTAGLVRIAFEKGILPVTTKRAALPVFDTTQYFPSFVD